MNATLATPTQLDLPLAIVQGEPLRDLPKGLYIPPNALKVLLTEFEGPLDLLSHLIRANKFDVRDIPVFEISRQYQQYIDLMQELDVELAGEYLFMAAWLTEIKSRMLLPKPVIADNEEDEDDPRAELMAKLLEYEAYQQAAQWLDSLTIVGRDVWPISLEVGAPEDLKPQLQFDELEQALRAVMQRALTRRAHHVVEEPIEIQDKMNFIMQQLCNEPISLDQLLRAQEGRIGVVVTFMALLELWRQHSIRLDQSDAFADIRVAKAA